MLFLVRISPQGSWSWSKGRGSPALLHIHQAGIGVVGVKVSDGQMVMMVVVVVVRMLRLGLMKTFLTTASTGHRTTARSCAVTWNIFDVIPKYFLISCHLNCWARRPQTTSFHLLICTCCLRRRIRTGTPWVSPADWLRTFDWLLLKLIIN